MQRPIIHGRVEGSDGDQDDTRRTFPRVQRLEALGQEAAPLFLVRTPRPVVQREVEPRRPVWRRVQFGRGSSQIEGEEGDARVVYRKAERDRSEGLEARIVGHVTEE